jgi:hypothetical protein
MKRTAAIVSVLLFLAAFLPGLSLYAAATCQMPCHSMPAACPYHAGLPGLSVPCHCGHNHDYSSLGRLQNENPVGPASALVAALPAEPMVPSAAFSIGSDLTRYSRTAIFCLTRSYRI